MSELKHLPQLLYKHRMILPYYYRFAEYYNSENRKAKSVTRFSESDLHKTTKYRVLTNYKPIVI